MMHSRTKAEWRTAGFELVISCCLVLDLVFRAALQSRFLRSARLLRVRRPAVRPDQSGTFSRRSLSQTVASESLGARQSPRGESDPPEPTFGPFGMALRLNWLIWKNRNR